MEPERIGYGEHEAEWGDLYRPPGSSRGVVVVLHGGFWRARYDASLGEPLARDLAGRGWTVWNLEYRRVGEGGGVPQTLDDVAAGIDHLAEVEALDLGTVVALGHSAGGHLALWAAARGRLPRWQPVRVPLTHVIAQAGVLDLGAAHAAHLGEGAVADFVGGGPDHSWDQVDPLRQVPLPVPVWCVHARQDDVVPFAQSQAYVEAAHRAGGTAEVVAVPGDHFTVIDTSSPAWARIVDLLDRVAR